MCFLSLSLAHPRQQCRLTRTIGSISSDCSSSSSLLRSRQQQETGLTKPAEPARGFNTRTTLILTVHANLFLVHTHALCALSSKESTEAVDNHFSLLRLLRRRLTKCTASTKDSSLPVQTRFTTETLFLLRNFLLYREVTRDFFSVFLEIFLFFYSLSWSMFCIAHKSKSILPFPCLFLGFRK